jgi:hypothetical protein
MSKPEHFILSAKEKGVERFLLRAAAIRAVEQQCRAEILCWESVIVDRIWECETVETKARQTKTI